MTFSSSDLDSMRATQLAHMPDTCRIIKREGGSVDRFNIPRMLEKEGRDISCGYVYDRGRNQTRDELGETEVAAIDAELRLPHGTEISTLDLVRITKRFGSVVNELFEVVGIPKAGPSGILIKIKKVTEK